jgi:hypothetical protein
VSIEGGLVESPNITANEFNLCRRAAEDLHRAYPGHLWAVSIDGGFLDVRNLMLSGRWGFRVPLTKMFSSSDWDKRVVMAGGEVLERYRVRRAQAEMDALAALPTNFAGWHTADK